MKKSVPIELENILLKYNVEAELEFCSSPSPVKDFDFETELRFKSRTDRRSGEEYTLRSTVYTYKVYKPLPYNKAKTKETKENFDVCSKEFLQQVEDLLAYTPE